MNVCFFQKQARNTTSSDKQSNSSANGLVSSFILSPPLNIKALFFDAWCVGLTSLIQLIHLGARFIAENEKARGGNCSLKWLQALAGSSALECFTSNLFYVNHTSSFSFNSTWIYHLSLKIIRWTLGDINCVLKPWITVPRVEHKIILKNSGNGQMFF